MFRSLSYLLAAEQLAVTLMRLAPRTRPRRNEGEEPVEMWAVPRKLGRSDSTKRDDFWEDSPNAAQSRS